MAVDFDADAINFISSSEKTFSSTSSDKTSSSQELVISINDHNPAPHEIDNGDIVPETHDNIDYDSQTLECSTPPAFTPVYSVETSITMSKSFETSMTVSKSFDTPISTSATPDQDNLIDELKLDSFIPSFDIDLETIDEKQSHSIVAINNEKQKQFIQHHITNDPNHLFNKYLCEMDPISTFDIMSQHQKKRINAISSSNGWSNGVHELSIQILQSEALYQEIGVVSVNENIHIDSSGIISSELFGAKAIYGNIYKNESITDNGNTCMYHYGSYNSDGYERCIKQLPQNKSCKVGDIIRVRVNLDTYRITFYVNDKNVRKTMSLQSNLIYFPIIAFYGECTYKLISFK